MGSALVGDSFYAKSIEPALQVLATPAFEVEFAFFVLPCFYSALVASLKA